MSGWEVDAHAVITFLLVLPLIVVSLFALVDILRRADLGGLRTVVYVLLVLFVVPAAVLYLLSRPTSIVRHRGRGREDWREDLVDHLDRRPGAPPELSASQERLLTDRVADLRN